MAREQPALWIGAIVMAVVLGLVFWLAGLTCLAMFPWAHLLGVGLMAAANKAISAIGRSLLYSRVDLVLDATGQFVLMELELIEPALYLRMDPGSSARFAAAIDKWMAAGR